MADDRVSGLEYLRKMRLAPETYKWAAEDLLRWVKDPQNQGLHSEVYRKIGDDLAQVHGTKSGSISDMGKNYAGGWDYATRDPENAAKKAALWQLRDYVLGSFDKDSQVDAGHDLEENLAGIDGALRFVGPPEPYEQLRSRAEDWAKSHPRPQNFAQGGAVGYNARNWDILGN